MTHQQGCQQRNKHKIFIFGKSVIENKIGFSYSTLKIRGFSDSFLSDPVLLKKTKCKIKGSHFKKRVFLRKKI